MNKRLPFLLTRPCCQQGSSVHAASAPHHSHPHPAWLARPRPRLPYTQRHRRTRGRSRGLPGYVSQPKLDPGSATRAAMSTSPDLRPPTRTVWLLPDPRQGTRRISPAMPPTGLTTRIVLPPPLEPWLACGTPMWPLQESQLGH